MSAKPDYRYMITYTGDFISSNFQTKSLKTWLRAIEDNSLSLVDLIRKEFNNPTSTYGEYTILEAIKTGDLNDLTGFRDCIPIKKIGTINLKHLEGDSSTVNILKNIVY